MGALAAAAEVQKTVKRTNGRKKPNNELVIVHIPRELTERVFPFVEERTAAFVRRYQVSQQYPQRHQLEDGLSTLADLCRAVYLQGAYDGFWVRDKYGDKITNGVQEDNAAEHEDSNK
jgi:hypothetical protein